MQTTIEISIKKKFWTGIALQITFLISKIFPNFELPMCDWIVKRGFEYEIKRKYIVP